jgi:hypothetical protein
MSEHILILQCDEDMAALKEVFDLIPSPLEFRNRIQAMLEAIIDICSIKSTAKEEIALLTNYFVARLEYLPRFPYGPMIVHAQGGVEVEDRRQDKRTVPQIVASLANNIFSQLRSYQLYDDQGILRYEIADTYLTWESLSIYLRKI